MLGESPHIMVAELSHPGEVRDHNEDRYLVKSYHAKGDNRPMLLAVVADGIGGHKAGEVAAQITADTIVNNLTASTVNDPVSQLRPRLWMQATRSYKHHRKYQNRRVWAQP